jgi:hypothetical protein
VANFSRPSNIRAEFHGKYFSAMKFSTQVLISLWKSAPFLRLTTQFSVLCSALHYFWAPVGDSADHPEHSEAKARIIAFNTTAAASLNVL